jgi:hypothetical protein
MMTAASIMLDSRNRRSGVIAQSKMTGAMITIPAASVSHHFAQVPIEMTGELAKPKALVRTGAAMAMPELITAVGAKEMSANLATWIGDAMVF